MEVLILMHPDEAGHAKNTGQLLHLCLPGSRIIVGEQFDPALLLAPWNRDTVAPAVPWLLYPETPNGPGGRNTNLPHRPCTRLVILDATWRKSRRMMTANPTLAQLPRLALDDVAASGYAIRKAHAPHQLSTLEAAHLGLRKLAPLNPSLDVLGEAMQALMALQRPFWPHARSA